MKEQEHHASHDPSFTGLVRQASASLAPVGEPIEAEASLRAFWERHAESTRMAPATGVRTPKSLNNESGRRGWFPVAVVAALSAILIAVITPVGRPTVDEPTVTKTYRTGANERATVQLGSATVRLAPATTMTARTTGPLGTNITIDGEALFTVESSSRAPFIVHAGRSTVRVLGTTFTVRRYDSERQTRVVVLDGRVGVRGANTDARDTVLSARMLAIVPDSGQVTIDQKVRVDDYTAWTNGRLVFRNVPVRHVIAEVGRTYDLDIRLADSTVGEHPLTLTIPVESQSAGQVLRVLEAILDAHVTRNGRIITLVPGRPATRRPDVLRLSPKEIQYGR
jgi:ferric-dicitrate binding protein FerR (iron transport regulator)